MKRTLTLAAAVVLPLVLPAQADDTPGAAEVREFLESAESALSMPLREDWARLQSPEFRAREIGRAKILLAHAADGNVFASAAVWLVTGRRPGTGITVDELLQATHPADRWLKVWMRRLDQSRVEELSCSGGSLEAVIHTEHARTRIWASWNGKRFLVDDAQHGARPRRADSPSARVFDRWRIALTMRDGGALFACLGDRKRAQILPDQSPMTWSLLRFLGKDAKTIVAVDKLNRDLEQTRVDPDVANAILRGPWKRGYASPVRQIYVTPGLPPVEVALEGKRWIVTTALEDFLAPSKAK